MAETYREAIVGIATELIDKPSLKYVSGHPELGQSPEHGFDCSGFVRFVLSRAGLHIPEYAGQDGVHRPIRHANEFWDSYGIMVHDENRQAGDLVFFSRTGLFPSHIGIMHDEESYIHAPGTPESKVKIQTIDYALIAKKSMERQLYSRNPIGFKSPSVVLDTPTYRSHQRPI